MSGDVWIGLNNGQGYVEIVDLDLKRDAGLESAIIISLFTDKREEDITLLPDNTGYRRGWWGDTEEFKIGSKLWLLYRSSATPDVPAKIEQYVKDALQWMIDDGVVKDVFTTVEIISTYTVGITVEIQQPDGQEQFYKYSLNWEAELIKSR